MVYPFIKQFVTNATYFFYLLYKTKFYGVISLYIEIIFGLFRNPSSMELLALTFKFIVQNCWSKYYSIKCSSIREYFDYLFSIQVQFLTLRIHIQFVIDNYFKNFLQIIRRSGPEEKYLCVVRHRQGHYCETACIIIVIVAWEGVEKDTANDMYSYLVSNLTKNGFETERRCGTNERQVTLSYFIYSETTIYFNHFVEIEIDNNWLMRCCSALLL